MKKSTSIGPLRYPESQPKAKLLSPDKGGSLTIDSTSSDLPPLK